ncbi:MAG TPA: transcriptional regulator [Bacteroidales bacterium]|jgi:DNA-binding transcriptional MerR regulator|nr:transcriptional regulator [Bacteroidales bacterium]
MERLYYKIAEVSDMLGIPAYTIRFWEKEFSELAPKRNEKGKRFYTNEDIEVLRKIMHLRYQKNLNITGARNELSHTGDDISRIQHVKKTLTDVRNELQDIMETL